MYAFVVLLALALGLSVVHQSLDEVLPIKAPSTLARTVLVALGAGVCWMLDYSVFTAFGQSLRADWMHPVMSGLVLVAFGEFSRSVIAAVAHRAGEPPVQTGPAPSIRAAA